MAAIRLCPFCTHTYTLCVCTYVCQKPALTQLLWCYYGGTWEAVEMVSQSFLSSFVTFFLVSGNAASHTTPKEQRDRAVTEWNMQFVGNVFTFLFKLNGKKCAFWRSGNSVRVQAANSIFARPHFVRWKGNFWHQNLQKFYSSFLCSWCKSRSRLLSSSTFLVNESPLRDLILTIEIELLNCTKLNLMRKLTFNFKSLATLLLVELALRLSVRVMHSCQIVILFKWIQIIEC